MSSQPAPNRLQGFPNASPGKDIIAHNGLSDEEAATASALGYGCVDIRFELGRRGAELTMLGVRQGTIILNATQLRTALAEVAAYAKSDTGIGSGNDTGPRKAGTDVSDYFKGLGSTNATGSWGAGVNTSGIIQHAGGASGGGPTANTVAAPEAPKAKTGRPKGAKDKQPRKRPGVLDPKTESDLNNMMEALINERREGSDDGISTDLDSD